VAELGPVTCAGCGLLCDDVTVELAGGDVVLRPECPLGAEWFSARMSRPAAPAATIDGEPVDIETALARAAELLRGARRPLVHGFADATVEDARAAVALADRLGAVMATDEGDWRGGPAVALRGASTATLGEIRDRAGLVVIWREDPQSTHPRLLERLGIDRARPERTLVVVDDRDTATARRADAQLRWAPERDLEALVSLRVLQRGLAPPSDGLAAELRGLIGRIGGVPHLAFVHGPGLTGGPGGQRRALALHELVRALCQERHAVTLELPAAPGTRSAGEVLAWQAGYDGNVDFGGRHPELAMGFDDADVRVRVEGGPAGSRVAGPGGQVWMRTAAAGVEASGTAHRLDGVPLALQAPRPSGVPTAAALLTRLLEQVQP
jgi:formylmethanofuran dehydrogenase subunit B